MLDVSAIRVSIGISVVVLLLLYLQRTWNRPPLPPGPHGRYPLLGMTFDMPRERPWQVFADWADKYGPLVHYRVGRQHFILVSDGHIARELLDKRAALYSSRPPSQVVKVISGGIMRSVMMPYGAHWRRIRRMFANVLTANKCDSYLKIQESETVATFRAILDHPSAFHEEIHRYSLSVVRCIAFGKRVQKPSDLFCVQVNKSMENFANAMAPDKYLFESIPSLRKLPRSMQPWLKELEQVRDHEHGYALENYRSALADAEKYPERPSLARDVQREMIEAGEVDELQAAVNCMEIIGAGSDTTANAILFTILALAAHPNVQKKAQEELDRVVGQDRLPTWADEPDLPYIRAIIKEQHRWRAIAPMGVSHWTDKEDIYDGYRIPANAVVKVNIWAIHMSPDRYPDPEAFQPERFLEYPLAASAYVNSDADQRDHYAYGNGKRICVGIHLAERSLFNIVSRMLHVFKLGPNGSRPLPTSPEEVHSALIMSPKHFDVKFEIRSEKVGKLLEREWKDKVAGVGESWL